MSKSLLDIENFMLKNSAEFRVTRPGNLNLAVEIGNISLDSRQIIQNDLFFAIQGESRHGLDFLQSVLQKLPGLVICDRALTAKELLVLQSSKVACSIWIVADINHFIGDFASWFYDFPSQKLNVVGITGTNGKTSTAFYTAQLLKQLEQPVALIGTLGNGPIDALKQSANTTPQSVTVHRLLHEFYQQGMQWVIMEVSSHGLCLGRIQGVHFQTVALTQVTRDHLDFHGTEQAYQEAKKRLFTDYVTQNQVINLGDTLGQLLCLQNRQNSQETIWCYQANQQQTANQQTANQQTADLSCLQSQLTPQGIEFDAQIKESLVRYSASMPLMGLFNLENVFCALSILLVNGFEAKTLFSHLNQLTSVSGRMQVLAKSPTILLDFAHTPDALQQILTAIKAHLSDSKGKLIVVFGCGGNRDQGKRPLMGAIAEALADKVMLTSDNPRDEEPQQILLDIVSGLKHPENVQLELDREKAILTVLKESSQQDIVVIAGKGHEDYQEIKGQKIPYSDTDVINKWLTNE